MTNQSGTKRMRPQDIKLSSDEIRASKEKTLIRIVDDDDSLRDALRFVLETEGWQVADHASARDFLTSDAPSTPGCVVLDIRMPGMSGIEAQRAMQERGIDLPIIFLTGHGDVDMAVSALQEGALDFIQKPVDNERLLAVIAYAAASNLAKREGRVDKATLLERAEALTDREKEIARALADGLVNREIAERLEIAQRTVEVHRAAVMRKLGIKKPAELASIRSWLEKS